MATLLEVRRMWKVKTLGLLALTALISAPGARAELKPGMILDQSNAEEAKDLLPPEIQSHYAKGEYKNQIVDFPNSKFHWDDGFAEASASNRDHLTLDANKQPVDKATGKRPDYLTGHPFPDIREDDPDAGIKVLWNTIYSIYNGGNSHNVSLLNWMSPTGVDRSSTQDVTFLYYDAQPKQYIPAQNPGGILWQFIALTVGPADLQGTAALSWRYKDPTKRDADWAYVPTLRRVRAVSPANRSDGFLGSDLSQDDGNFFDGKPEDFTWKLAGHRDAMRITDPAAIEKTIERRALPEGGWRTPLVNGQNSIGFQVKDWKGIAWAPVAGALTKRKVWVIEGVPKDKYYLYGKIELWIDDYTWEGAWNRRFSWQGQLMNTYQVMEPVTAPFNDKEHWLASTFGYQLAENVKANRATIAGLIPPGDVANDRRIPLSPSFFDYNALNRFGK